ncbi:solute carrier family 22 member 18 [Thalassophryne amazonica]|uniref:solute carrier family 22 member 18 n=1 Tax=Thalassophryne amazonica TaxID=390379 RepID=UPI001470B6D2|nr:solute carrier family 22 member 18 [Thalassophryne amazonica]
MRQRDKTTEETTRNMTSDISPGQRRKTVFIAFIIAALNMICMFLTFAVTPYLAKKLGFDVLWFGYLQTTVGIVQLIGGPVFGRFADLVGAQAALSVACSATVVSFLLLAIADRPAMLFIHKLPTVFMHVLPVTQMVVTDLSEPQKRTDALSKLSLCFGIGLIVGSPLGGTLSTRYGETFAACFGAVVAFASLILVHMFIPKSTKVQAPRSKTDDKKKNESLFSLREITRLMTFPGVISTFVVKMVAGLPSGESYGEKHFWPFSKKNMTDAVMHGLLE